MKAITGAVFLSLVLTGTAAAQGAVGLFGDSLGTSCYVYDDSPGTFDTYAVHVNHIGARATRFSVQVDYGRFDATYIGARSRFFTDGDVNSGITICYNACVSQPTHVLTITYFGTGSSTNCTFLGIAAHPDAASGSAEMVDCSRTIHAVPMGQVIVNPDPTCTCHFGAHPAARVSVAETFPYCEKVPNENDTWGRIKALYE